MGALWFAIGVIVGMIVAIILCGFFCMLAIEKLDECDLREDDE